MGVPRRGLDHSGCRDRTHPGGALALPETPIAFDSFALALPNGSSLNLDRFLQATATEGIVILHDGRMVFEFYSGGTSKATPQILMSATKSIVGRLTGILHQCGDLDVETVRSITRRCG